MNKFEVEALALCALLGIDGNEIQDEGLPTHGQKRIDVIAGVLAGRKRGMTSRDEVYLAIDSERDYQDELWHTTLTVGEFVLLLEEYAEKARATWCREVAPETGTMEVVRKVAALAVACMEHYGAPWRQTSPRSQ